MYTSLPSSSSPSLISHCQNRYSYHLPIDRGSYWLIVASMSIAKAFNEPIALSLSLSLSLSVYIYIYLN